MGNYNLNNEIMDITKFPYQNGPWQIMNRKIAYQSKYAKVYEDDVVRPDGNEGIHIYLTSKNGVAVVPYDKDKNIYLVEIFRYAHQKFMIEAIVGGIDENENIESAAARELKEESGIIGKNYELIAMTTPKTEIYSSKDYTFICEVDYIQECEKEGTESIRLRKLSLDEAIRLVNNLEITQEMAIIAILKLQQKLQ